MNSAIERALIANTPLIVVDLETTGLLAGGDKIVEIGIVRVDPGEPPRIVLDTLIDPHRRVTATEIHGITDADVVGAPGFEQVAGNVVDALSDGVMAAYNVYFDVQFLGSELSRAGTENLPPYICLMYMRSLLDMGRKCTLDDSCKAFSIDYSTQHHAAADALAGAKLWQAYLSIINERGLSTFQELGEGKKYKFLSSFENSVFDKSSCPSLRRTTSLKPRRVGAVAQQSEILPRVPSLSEYWDALMTALSNMDLSDSEERYLLEKQTSLGLSVESVRWMHGRAFASILGQFGEDRAIGVDEAHTLWRIAGALRRLGWAPGDAPAAVETAARQPSGDFLGRLFGRRA
jgi:DNA polymerase III subunit epsilon